MEIYEQSEIFTEDGDDLAFDHTKLILKSKSGDFFYSTTTSRLHPSVSIDINTLQVTPVKDFWPQFDPTLTHAPEPLPKNHYIKRPSLLFYSNEQAQDLSNQILNEARICEILRKNPHPSVAEYLGCIAERGRLQGLCFIRYSMGLIQRVKSGKPLNCAQYLQRIKSGMLHLHSLGLVHNDLNPRNIMIDENDCPVIIDFDSCRQEGEELIKSGTPGWAIEDAQRAARENDYYSFSLIQEYLLGHSS